LFLDATDGERTCDIGIIEMAAKVWITVLTDGTIRHELTAALISMSHDGRYALEFHFSFARPISSNRCLITKRFLASDADWLLMIDNDVWPYANLLDLVEADKDVVVFPTPILRLGVPEPPIISNITPLNGNIVDFDEAPLIEVLRGGGSAMLLSRRVLEGVERPAFAYTFDEDGVALDDEDMYFCAKARAAGFEIWAAYSHPCGHFKEVDIVAVHSRVKQWDYSAEGLYAVEDI